MEFAWDKPTVVLYKERLEKPERKAFAVVMARRLRVEEKEVDGRFKGNIMEFFPLMGDIDYISTDEGKADRYVLCWSEDKEDDFSRSWRRLTGVAFREGIAFITNGKGKRSYSAAFTAEHGKLK